MTSVREWICICVNKENNSASFWSLFPTPSLANRFITHKIHSIWMLRMIAVAMCCGVRLPGDHTRCRMLLLLLLLNAPGQQQPYQHSFQQKFARVFTILIKTSSMAFQDFENICKVLSTTSLSSWFQAMATRSSPTGSNSATKSSSRWTYYVHVWSWCCSK